ncbi:heparinase II/III family protein [Carboxydochorda subterranea]|uniref:Heparinase II/III family protein n=1 Tax=Carboxydichorda subterranea TaxID=3109565 RepID=A0ABZ1BVG1_9FIRM|nr:heparinase II/III family protein [Limnochorda sp. L945t]WRP16578.1 heparinase II/III family protein [Limnochorda sp. L945t]
MAVRSCLRVTLLAACLAAGFSVASLPTRAGENLARPAGQSSRPYVLFGKDDIPRLREKVQSGVAATWWATVRERAERALSKVVEKTSERDLRYDVLDLAFAYLITDDDRYGLKAREILLNIDRSVQWRPGPGDFPWRWPQLTMQTALAYDWIAGAGLLNEEEDRRARALIAQAAKIIYDGLRGPEDQKANPYWNLVNFRLRNDAGLGVTALALGDFDDPELGSAEEWAAYAQADLFGESGWVVDHYLSQMVTADGVYKEGSSYAQDSFRMLIPYLYAMKRVRGVDYFRYPQVRNLFGWLVKTMLPDGSQPSVDTGWAPAAYSSGMHHWVASQYPEEAPAYMWAWQKEGRPVPAGDQVLAIIFYEPAMEASAAPPRWEPTQFFEEGGYAVLRSGWNDDATMMLLLAEHVPDRSSHEQPDQTSFLLFSRGAYLAIDPGDGRDYPDRRHYWIRSPYAHNLVIVDGQSSPEVAWSYSEVKDPAYFDLTLAARGADIARVRMHYDKVDVDIRRTVLFARREYFIVVDDLHSDGEHRYDWQIHLGRADRGKLDMRPDGATWTIPNDRGRNVSLDIWFAAPSVQLTSATGPTNYVPRETFDHVYLKATSNGQDARYVTFLYPRYESDPPPQLERLPASGGEAFALFDGERLDVLLLRSADTGDPATNSAAASAQSQGRARLVRAVVAGEEIEADAELLYVSRDHGVTRVIAGIAVGNVRMGKDTLISTGAPVTAVWETGR